MKTEEKINEIKKRRSSEGFFSAGDMAKMFNAHGVKMTRQSYINKETGKTKFTVDEVRVLSDVFRMGLEPTLALFYDEN